MTAEKRWLEEGASPEVSELLESVALDEPTREDLDGLRSRVAFLFAIPPGGGAGGGGGDGGAAGGGAGTGTGAGTGAATQAAGSQATSAGVAASATTGASAAGVAQGLVAAGAAVVLAVGGVWAGIRSTSPQQANPVVQAAPVPQELAAAADKAEVPAVLVEEQREAPPAVPPPPAPVKPAPRPRTAPVAVERTSPPPPPPPPPASADEELELLQKAMSHSEPEQALATVEQHQKRFPDSPLAQEREVIAVQALVKLGRMEAAQERARRFRAAWPTSTHLMRLEVLLQRGPGGN